MPGIKREIIFRQVLGNLNANPGAYATPASQDEDYDDFAVMDAILNQEAFLLHKIAESWFNGNRTNESGLTDIINTQSVANGALIPRHIGPVIGIEINGLLAEQCAAAEVARLRTRNPLNLKLHTQLFGLLDNRLYFTSDDATNASVFLFQFVRPTFTTITNFKNSDSPVPPEYHQCWVDLSTAAVISREGAMLQARASYSAAGLGVLGEIEREHRPRPFLKDAQQAGL